MSPTQPSPAVSGARPATHDEVPLRGLLNNVGDAVTAIDRSGAVRYANPAFCNAFRVDAERIVGARAPLPIWPASQHDCYMRWYERTVVRGDLEEDPLRADGVKLADAEGAPIVASVTMTALRDSKRQPWLFYAIVRPERTGADERLDHVEQGLWRIAAELARLGVPGEAMAPVPPAATERLSSLPHRQREIVEMLLAGHRVATIARTLHLSPHTVRNHLKAVFERFGVRSQPELIAQLRGGEWGS